MKRCVAIAKAIRLLGGSVLFVTREDSDTSLIESNFMEYETVPSMTLGSEKAINCLKDIISEKNAKVCVVDSYDVSNTAFNSLKEVCKVILIEDYLYEVYDVDCLINYNLYADKIDYMSKYKSNTKLLLGIEYAPYGNEFLGSFRVIDRHDIDSIMVYTGELASLKRGKDDAKEVSAGMECGIGIDKFNDVKVGDNIEAFTITEIKQTLD